MTKKDRIAVSISITWILIIALIAASQRRDNLEIFSVFSSPVFFYWAYRFIQNDLAFLQRNPKTTNDKNNIGAIDSKADVLSKWNELLAKGAITQEEYDKAKRDLLG